MVSFVGDFGRSSTPTRRAVSRHRAASMPIATVRPDEHRVAPGCAVHDGGGDRGHDRDAHGDADLLAHRGEPGRQPLLAVGHAGGRGDHEPDDRDQVGDAADEGRDQDQRQVARGRRRASTSGAVAAAWTTRPPTIARSLADGRDHPGPTRPPITVPAPRTAKASPACERRVAEHVLQVQGQQEDQRGLGGERHAARRGCPSPPCAAEHVERDQRLGDPLLDDPEGSEQDDAEPRARASARGSAHECSPAAVRP